MDENKKDAFVASLLLASSNWDSEKFKSDLKIEWGIEIPTQTIEKDGTIVFENNGMTIAVSLMQVPVPNNEAENFAKANYMWQDALEVTQNHKAHLLIAIIGKDAQTLDKATMFVKISNSLLKQDNALALYADGAVYQPEYYNHFAQMIHDDYFPVYNLVWFGLYNDGEIGGVYTYGLEKFGKTDMEVYVGAAEVDYEELRSFLVNIASYVIESDVTLLDGETIGFTAEQKCKISKSKGIAIYNDSLKITYIKE